MAHERRYDYGMRGYADTTMRRGENRPRGGAGEGAGRDRGGLRDRREEQRTPRVTALYNREYIYGARGEDDYPRSYKPYEGDRPGRIVDARAYRQPYTTISGTRTFRGSSEPRLYDRDYYRYERDFRRR